MRNRERERERDIAISQPSGQPVLSCLGQSSGEPARCISQVNLVAPQDSGQMSNPPSIQQTDPQTQLNVASSDKIDGDRREDEQVLGGQEQPSSSVAGQQQCVAVSNPVSAPFTSFTLTFFQVGHSGRSPCGSQSSGASREWKCQPI